LRGAVEALPVRLRDAADEQRSSHRFGETAFACGLACPAEAHLRKAASRKVSECRRKRLGVEPAADTDSKGLTGFSNSADPQISILCRVEPPNCPQQESRLTALLTRGGFRVHSRPKIVGCANWRCPARPKSCSSLRRPLRLGDLENRPKGPVHRRRVWKRLGDIVFEQNHIRAGLVRHVVLPAFRPGEVVLTADFVNLTSSCLRHRSCVPWARLPARG